MQQESNAKNKQIESLDHLIEGINKLKNGCFGRNCNYRINLCIS